jgi:hypothetical protein
MSLTLHLRSPALLLALALACTPKPEDTADDGGSSGSEEGTVGISTTSGDPITTGTSDPTMPGSATEATASDATTTPGTSVSTVVTTEGNDEVTSEPTITSVGTTPETDPTSDTETTGPDVPPPACEGDAKPIVATTIFAYTEAQVPPEPDPTMSGSGGDPNPPDTLYVKLSDQEFTCEDPNAFLECGPHWEVTIVIKPEFQFPGVYDLLDTDGIFGTSLETSTPDGMGECGGGGGSFGATFELINITDTTVEGRLCNVEAFFFETDPELNGSFVADRCQ